MIFSIIGERRIRAIPHSCKNPPTIDLNFFDQLFHIPARLPNNNNPPTQPTTTYAGSTHQGWGAQDKEVADTMESQSDVQPKPGRLSITCIDARQIRGRADNDKEPTPNLVFKLNGTERASRTGTQIGHDIDFNNEVLSFDIVMLDDVELVVEVCDETSKERIGSATFSVANVLASGSESLETLKIIKPGDTTTNSEINLKFAFTQAKHGVIKLAGGAVGDGSEGLNAMISTADGQSQRVALADADDVAGFWIDQSNWFGQFTVEVYKGQAYIGSAKLSMLECLSGKEMDNAIAYIPIDIDGSMQTSPVALKHWFLEAGFVQVQSITATNLRDVSIDSTGLVDPRVLIKTSGKTHSTEIMTNTAERIESNIYHWNSDDIRLPIVDEYSLAIECCELDEVSKDKEPIGVAEVSLLPLFKSGSFQTSLDILHLNEVREVIHS